MRDYKISLLKILNCEKKFLWGRAEFARGDLGYSTNTTLKWKIIGLKRTTFLWFTEKLKIRLGFVLRMPEVATADYELGGKNGFTVNRTNKNIIRMVMARDGN